MGLEVNQKIQLMKIVKFIVGALFIIAALGMFAQKEILAGLISAVLGTIILPPVSEKLRQNLKQWNNRGARYVSYVLLLAVIGLSTKKAKFPSPATTSTIKTNSEDVANQSPYQNYLDEVAKNISALSPERKDAREKILTELKSNPVYGKLVTEKVVSSDYLPALNAITNGITQISGTNFGINSDLEQQVTSSTDGDNKMSFVAKVISLAIPNANGGLPKEIIDVFDRYKSKFNASGVKGTAYDLDKNPQEIKYDYDLTPFFALMNPNNKELLQELYEAKSKGLSSWNEKGNYTFPYLATKEGFLAKLKQVDPNSNLFPKVDLEISASELYRAYEANEVSTDGQYKGKRLLLTGVVGTIGKDVLDNPYISLKVDYLKSVNCYFDDKNNGILSQLSKGQKVQIIGTCSGLSLMDVVIKDCELWE